MTDREIRSLGLELRAVGRKLVGYAAVFNQRADLGGFQEVVLPGAMARSLASGADVVATVDHDGTKLLGRVAAGTLRLSEDHKGLAFEIDTPDTSLGRDTLEQVRRGDIRSASFAFRAVDETWPTRELRELRSVDLFDVALVQSTPAYSGTSVSLRHRPEPPEPPTPDPDPDLKLLTVDERRRRLARF